MDKEFKPVEPLDASTVILVREAADDIEVYMTRRQEGLVFLGGYHVFPGGKVDREDRSDEAVSRCLCLSPEDAAARIEGMDDPRRAFALFCAGARELFEEAGVLIAAEGDGSVLEEIPESIGGKLSRRRESLQRDGLLFHRILEETGLYVRLSSLLWFAHWVTPAFSPRRFNTFFFLARKPGGQRTRPFAAEVSEAVWIKPAEALAKWKRGEWKMIPPTISSLDTLSRYQSWESLCVDYSLPPAEHKRTVWKG